MYIALFVKSDLMLCHFAGAIHTATSALHTLVVFVSFGNKSISKNSSVHLQPSPIMLGTNTFKDVSFY